MQQTSKYALNLIERGDTFSPDPLNENMEKVEAALGTVRAEAAADDSALDLRVQALEARRIAYGVYTGTGADQTISLGFTPGWLYIQSNVNAGVSVTATLDVPYKNTYVKVVSGGFSVNANSSFTQTGIRYLYLAIL